MLAVLAFGQNQPDNENRNSDRVLSTLEYSIGVSIFLVFFDFMLFLCFWFFCTLPIPNLKRHT
jgi:hypothetical protein